MFRQGCQSLRTSRQQSPGRFSQNLQRAQPGGSMVLFALRVFLLGMFLAGCSSAWADHMTGRYSGTGQVAGTDLELRQSGTSLQGQFSGATQGTLTGQSDGANKASGTIAIPGAAPLQFQGEWSPTNLTLRLQSGGGSTEYVFSKGGSSQSHQLNPPQPTPPQLQPPQPQPPSPPSLPDNSAVEYYVAKGGQPVGPLSLEQARQELAAGTLSGSDLAWKTGLADWARIDSMPELLLPRRDGPPPLPPIPPSPFSERQNNTPGDAVPTLGAPTFNSN